MLARVSRCLRDLELRRSLRRMQRQELSVAVRVAAIAAIAAVPRPAAGRIRTH